MTKDRIATLRVLAGTGAQGQKSDAIRELCDYAERREAKKKAPAFTVDQVRLEAERMEWPNGLGDECFDRYEMVGWCYGRNRQPIKSLVAAMRHFKRNKDKFAPVNGNGTNHFRI